MNRIRIAGIALATVVVGAGIVYGPQTIAGYRFQSAFEAYSHQQLSLGGAWPQVQPTCNFCHGNNGQSANTQYASLAGQPKDYLESQLKAFAAGTRPHPTMAPLAASLGDKTIADLASFYAQQAPRRNETPKPDGTMDTLGKTVVAQRACASCHGPDLMGTPIAPRIAGQGESYLADQLTAFAENRRNDPSGAMNPMAKALQTVEINGVSHYLASLEPKPTPK